MIPSKITKNDYKDRAHQGVFKVHKTDKTEKKRNHFNQRNNFKTDIICLIYKQQLSGETWLKGEQNL